MIEYIRMIRSQWDRTAAVVALGSGLLALIIGWLGVSGTVIPGKQLPYLVSGAIFGLFSLGVAATLWLSADLRDEWRKMNEVSWKLSKLSTAIGVNGEPALGAVQRPTMQTADRDWGSDSIPMSRELHGV